MTAPDPTTGEDRVCWLNEDCIAGPHEYRVQCRFPSWTDDAASPPAVAASTGTSEDVDTVARVLMAAWEAAEGKPVGVSYVATHADMARAVLASDWLAAREAAARAEAWDEACEHDIATCRGDQCAYNPYRIAREGR